MAATETEVGKDEVRIASSPTVSSTTTATAPDPELIHDGESYRIYRATLPATSFGSSSTQKVSQQRISVAIKMCQPNNGHTDLSDLNNEYNILKLGRVANCRSARSALKTDTSFQAPSQADENNGSDGPPTTTAIYLDWVEGITLSDWIKREKQEDGNLTDDNHYNSSTTTETDTKLKDESARLLDKVRVAFKLADAVANIHEAGVVHNDLNGDNVIISLDKCSIDSNSESSSRLGGPLLQATIIDFGYADQSSQMEGNDEGDRVNDDIHQLETLLRNIFAEQEGGEAQKHGASLLYSDPFLRQLSYGTAHGAFSRTFQNDEAAGSALAHSIYEFKGEGNASLGTSINDDTESLTNSDGRSSHTFGVPQSRLMGNIDEGLKVETRMPRNLPRSVRRVLSDIRDAGHDIRESVYHNAREVAEDLKQMTSDPAVFLADPTREDTAKRAFRRPPLRLYGREHELAVLRGAEDRLMSGIRGNEVGFRTEVVLIAGRSGSGKSSIIRQARSDSKGVFVVGKFDQLQSMQPYSALISAFDQVVHSIISEDAHVVANIKEDILNAVGTNGKVLTDVIPSLIQIIGEQPEVAQVTGIEAQNRFRYITQCFARAICTAERPLICVLDDLQWCDSASIDLMKILVTDGSNTHLLLIGCYRDDEMDAEHHVSIQFDQMKKANVKFTTIELGTMDIDSLASFVSERLRLPRRLTKSMSEIVYRKSLGNPFFATTFLESLAEVGLLKFSPVKMRWLWNEAEADAMNISDDVVEVMAEKIQTLEPTSQDLIKIASCIGATFDASIVKSVIEEDSSQAMLGMNLKKLADHGLIIKMIRRDDNDCVVQYKFSHDRIQQAAYSLVSEDEKEAMHLRIGRILEKRLLSDITTASLIFNAVDQLNRGAECMVDRDERVALAKLNVMAAEKAYNACAFCPSTNYAQTSLGILGSDDTVWNNHYDLALTLYNLLAELKYCEGNFNEAMQITRRIFQRAKTFDDQFIAQTCNLKSMMLNGDMDDTLTTSLVILRVLGEPLPKKPTRSAVLTSLIKTKKALRTKSDEYLTSLPEMTDKRVMKIMEILKILVSAVYSLGSDYVPIVIFKMIRLTLKCGLADSSSYAISVYGLLMYAVLKDVKGACRFGQLGVSISSKVTMPRSSFLMYGFIAHWRDNIGLTLDPLLNGFKEGLKSGDIEYACYNLNCYTYHSLHSGQASIQAILHQQQVRLQELIKFGTNSASERNRPCIQAALSLAGQTQDPFVLTDEVIDEEGQLKKSTESGKIPIEYNFRYNAACVAYIFGDYDRASMHSLKIQDIAAKFPAIYSITIQAFYDGLSSYALARTEKNCNKWRKRGRKISKKFANWAKYCPSNNTHKFLLLKAEDASLFATKSKKKREIAEQAYNAAILAASNSGFVNVAAIASERAAEFYNSTGQDEQFSKFIAQAYKFYLKWGACGKCQHMAKKYPGITFNTQNGQRSIH